MNIVEHLDSFTRMDNGNCFFSISQIQEIPTTLIDETKVYLEKHVAMAEVGLYEFSPLEKIAFMMIFDERVWSNGNKSIEDVQEN